MAVGDADASTALIRRPPRNDTPRKGHPAKRTHRPSGYGIFLFDFWLATAIFLFPQRSSVTAAATYRKTGRIAAAALLAATAVAAAPIVRCELLAQPLLPAPSAEGERDAAGDGELLPDLPAPEIDGQPIDDTMHASSDEFVLLDEPAPAYSSGQWLFSGGWYFHEDVVVLQKADLDDQLLAFDATNPSLGLFTSTDTPTFEPGARITLGKIYGRDVWNRDHMVEFRFFGLFDWPTQARIVRTFEVPDTGINTRLGPNAGDIQALYGNQTQRFLQHSSLDSYELNVRMRTRGSRDRLVLQHDGHWVRHQTRARIWSCYAGFTTLFLDEQFDLLGVGEGATRGRYLIGVDNDLIGVHFGGQYVEQAAIWNWGLRGRLAGLANFAQRQSSFASQIGAAAPTTRSDREEKDNLAFLLEGGIFASLQVHPNASLRVGYDVLFISGVAQSIGNLNLPVGSFSPMEVNDSALYHGGSLGFTMVW